MKMDEFVEHWAYEMLKQKFEDEEAVVSHTIVSSLCHESMWWWNPIYFVLCFTNLFWCLEFQASLTFLICVVEMVFVFSLIWKLWEYEKHNITFSTSSCLLNIESVYLVCLVTRKGKETQVINHSSYKLCVV